MPHILHEFDLITPAELIPWVPAMADVPPTVIDELCSEVTALIEREAGRLIVKREHTLEEHEGTGTCYMDLANPPVESITVADWNGDAITVADLVISNRKAGIVYWAGGFGNRPGWDKGAVSGVEDGELYDPIFRSGSPGFAAVPDLFHFTYTGGFDRDSPTALELRTVARKLATAIFNTTNRAGYKSETIGSYGYTLDGGLAQGVEAGSSVDPAYQSAISAARRLRIRNPR